MNPAVIKDKKTPAQIAKFALAYFKEKANAEKAEQVQRYFKEPVKVYGLSAKPMHDLAKELYKKIKPYWSVNEAIELCEILLPNPFMEAKGIATLLLIRFRKNFPKELFFKIEEWLSANYCNNWAAVDMLCPVAMETLLIKYPELREKIMEWPASLNRWVRRAAAVSFIKLARQGKQLDLVYRIALSLFPDDDDLVQKANGWLLREAGKSNHIRLENFLLKHGPAIPRTTLRYAIERFEEKKRKKMLIETKAKKEKGRVKKN
ncbi:MAG: DNA alkylation repair protein [Candidatus Aminicenantes bacterium]|nr:DNA alkylation repair protein [Candidatus Aminicenantes bacterium]